MPTYRGCSCPEWSLYNNDTPSITAHLINKKIDGGKIIEKRKIRKKFKSYKDFRTKLYIESINLGTIIINKLYKKKKMKLYPQKITGKYYKPIVKADEKDLKKSVSRYSNR